jgi:G:T/U-mismatch repair DNA glycosylase
MLKNLSEMILWCVHYYQHKMNSFWKLFNVLFGEIQDYFFVTEFQNEGLTHDHVLLWVQNALQFGISSNETIENFIDKYITTKSNIFSNWNT